MGKLEMVRLGDVLNYEQPTKFIVERTDYDDSYNTPVLTAGKSFILGYTNEVNNIYTNIPVIIFDDFTTAIKYVDFPFKVKSSAMKILRATERADIKYMFYFLNTISIDTRLHKRYWLSEYVDMQVPLPPLPVQQQIANSLDRASKLIECRKLQIDKLDLLMKSKFIEMFGDPVINPKGWIKKPLAMECDVVTGNTPSRAVSKYYGSFIEWIKSDNINSPDTYLTQASEMLSEAGLSVGRSVNAGTILMTCIAGSISCIGNVAIANRKVSFNQQINAIIPQKNNVYFMYYLFLLSKSYIQSTVNMSLKGILSKGKLLEIEFPFPPINLQTYFGDFIQRIETQKTLLQQSLVKMEQNYKSLMQKCFRGEIF